MYLKELHFTYNNCNNSLIHVVSTYVKLQRYIWLDRFGLIL